MKWTGGLVALAWAGLAYAETPVIETGRSLTEQFLLGQTAGLWDQMTPRMQEALGSERALGSFSRSITDQTGRAGRIIGEETQAVQGFDVYLQTRQFPSADRPLLFQWALDGEGRIAGFFVKPQPDEPSAAFEQHETATRLSLPFSGEWTVVWGGRKRSQNYHADSDNQRYAYDFLITRDGATHAGDPALLESYFCWGQPILAPADGVVTVAIDGLPDQVPGEMDPSHPPGNHVVLDHGNGERSLLAHLRNGSVAVTPGEAVSRGQQLGVCGNSGNTTEPHLHFQLQQGAAFGEGHGLPAPFVDLLIDGEPVDRAEPVRGQVVSPRPTP